MATMEQKAPSIHTGAQPRIYKNFIDGEWVESHTGRTFENLNPADTREVVGIFQRSDREDVNAPSRRPSRPSRRGDWCPRRAALRCCTRRRRS